MLIQLVADYGKGDLAFAETQQQLLRFLPGSNIVTTSVAPFDTLAAGFIIAQLALNSGPQDELIYHNVAPRFDDLDPRHDNAGEGLAAGRTKTGRWVVGPNSGYSFSFIYPHLQELRLVDVADDGSQFRSRDVFPQTLPRLLDEAETLLGEKTKPNLPAPENRVVYVDGYGNIKTTLTGSFESGQRVLVQIGEAQSQAVISDGSFAVGHGELALAPGSSGWPGSEPSRFYELFLRGASAANLFANPDPGAAITVIEI